MSCRIRCLSTTLTAFTKIYPNSVSGLRIDNLAISNQFFGLREFSSTTNSILSKNIAHSVSFNFNFNRNPLLNGLSNWNLSGGTSQIFVREYHVKEGSIKWRRRKGKEIDQRLKVINPSSPVINHRVPLPPNNMDKIPLGLFGGERVKDPMKEEQEQKDVLTQINHQIQENAYGRLFAVLNLKGKQFKVTDEDIIILHGYWAPNVGDRLRLHKILLVGGSDFTLIGRPLLDDSIIRVEGTVIEKTLSYTKLNFRLKKRKNYRRLKFHKEPYTMVRINMIQLPEPLAILEESKSGMERDKVVDAIYRKSAIN